MKKAAITVLMLALMIGMTSCGAKEQAGKTEEPASTTEEQISTAEDQASITEDQALNAVKEYCHINNPDLEEVENEGEYPVYWEVSTNEDNEIVVLYRSYTGAEIRYYVDPTSGETYVTEFVSGITDEEERTDETLNVKDYIK